MSAFHLCGAANSVASVKIEHNSCADTGLGWGCFGPYGKKARVDSRILRLDLPQNAAFGDVFDGNREIPVKGHVFVTKRTPGVSGVRQMRCCKVAQNIAFKIYISVVKFI